MSCLIGFVIANPFLLLSPSEIISGYYAPNLNPKQREFKEAVSSVKCNKPAIIIVGIKYIR